MLRSESRRFIFVHIQKTGGTSIKRAIRPHVRDAKQFLGTHDHAIAGLEKLGPEWKSYFTFAFVRNPWDRLVSWYAMISRVELARIGQNQRNEFWKYVRDNASTFEEFVTRCTDVVEDFDGRKSIMFNQVDYVADADGQLIVDYIGRFENFEDEISSVFERLRIAGANLPHAVKSRHLHYSQYYTPALRDLVGERYRRDIAQFGYEFEEAESR